MVSRKLIHNPDIRYLVAQHYNAEPYQVHIARCGRVTVDLTSIIFRQGS